MSIRLTKPTRIAGAVKTVADGVLQLNHSLEADLVARGRATEVDPTSDRKLIQLLPTEDVTQWNTDKTAALVVTVDHTVLFEGRPTIKVVIPAGTSGVVKIGTATATARIPFNWDRSNFMFAIRCTNLSAINGAITPYLGDAAYANFYTCGGQNVANFPEMNYANNGWIHFKPDASGSGGWGTGGGTPAMADTMRAKLQWTAASQATDVVLWIGAFGVMPPRPKPTIIITADDGYASWHSFMAPLMRHYKMPCSMGISCDQVGGANFMSEDQILDLHHDPLGLFDMVNHSANNDPNGTLGARQYFANVMKCERYLRRIGIDHDGPLHHPYVQSQWDNDLVALLKGAGFLSARASAYSSQASRDQALASGDQLRWKLNICTNLQAGKSVSQALADVDAVIAGGGFGMANVHDFGPADGAYIYAYANWEKFVGELAARWAAGLCEVKAWSPWFRSSAGFVLH